jgi:von Willebrand factor type A domain
MATDVGSASCCTAVRPRVLAVRPRTRQTGRRTRRERIQSQCRGYSKSSASPYSLRVLPCCACESVGITVSSSSDRQHPEARRNGDTRVRRFKQAARRFVEKQPSSIKIGVVAFSDGGVITQKPTSDRTQIIAAIDRLKAQGGTSLGQGIFSALNAISGTPIVIPTGVDPSADSDAAPSDTTPASTAPAGSTDPATRNDLARVDVDSIKIGYFGNSAIVLLSDGENTSNPNPVDLGELASVAGVKIYPIGIGKSEGAVIEVDGFKIATTLDEEMLQEVAKRSGGTYFAAPDAESLSSVYDRIDLKWGSTPTKTELTGVFAAFSAALFGIGALLSLKWFGRLV